MKTASISSLRVAHELRQAAESVLQEGETLSSFVEQSIRARVERRNLHKAFIARGLVSREEAKSSGEYFRPLRFMPNWPECWPKLKPGKEDDLTRPLYQGS
jgi:hypothetical protein